MDNLLEAWKEFKRGKSKKEDVQLFEMQLMDDLIALHNDLKSGDYEHGAYEHFVINDPKRRDIHKASVRDRVLHHAIYRKLYTFFDKTFISDSYSCRNYKGTHKAIDRYEIFARKVSKNYTKQAFVLKCDIRKFFASIDQAILIEILNVYILDKKIVNLLTTIIHSFSSSEREKELLKTERRLSQESRKGLPLGNLTSQLFVNIYMNVFDQHVKHILKVKYYIRYADDFVILGESREELVTLCQECEAFLTQSLSLSMHPDKVYIQTVYAGLDYLGWVHFPRHRVLRTSTKKRMFRKVNEINMQSYIGLLSHGDGYRLIEKINDRLKLIPSQYFDL